jgi:hypothetical protein
MVRMAGASDQTQRVEYVNANWVAARDGDDGAFELLIVTEDDVRHTIAPGAAAMSGLMAMIGASPVLLWDPAARTLIAANIVGEWLPLDWSRRGRPDDRSAQPEP